MYIPVNTSYFGKTVRAVRNHHMTMTMTGWFSGIFEANAAKVRTPPRSGIFEANAAKIRTPPRSTSSAASSPAAKRADRTPTPSRPTEPSAPPSIRREIETVAETVTAAADTTTAVTALGLAVEVYIAERQWYAGKHRKTEEVA
jgi:hypothetical protein